MAERTEDAARPLVNGAGGDDALNRRIHLMNVLTALRLRLGSNDALPLPFAADSPHTESDGNQTETGREERANQENESAARRRDRTCGGTAEGEHWPRG